MKGNEIIVSSEPRGVFKEGTIVGAILPGTIVELVPNSTMNGGRPQWRPTTRAAGGKGLIAVLLPDDLQGMLPTTAYTDGSRCKVYCPAHGEELNLLVEVPGTGGGAVTFIGESLEVAGDNTGHLITTTQANRQFTAMEAVTESSGATTELTWCMFEGGN